MSESILGNQFVKIAGGTTAERPSSPVIGMVRYNTDTDFLEWYDGNEWGDLTKFVPVEATGGTVNDVTIGSVDYRIHEFTSTGTSTFDVTDIGSSGFIDVLLVAGGGGGGGTSNNRSSSGYGGEAKVESLFLESTGSYTITVGDGGNGVSHTTSPPAGDDSSFSGQSITVTAEGGAGGNSNFCCPSGSNPGEPGYEDGPNSINFDGNNIKYGDRPPPRDEVNCGDGRVNGQPNTGDAGSGVWCSGSATGGSGGSGIVKIRYPLLDPLDPN